MSEQNQDPEDDRVITLKDMYKDYFLDYASYVIMERAVPYVEDGLKPVQRRILHALKKMDDGRFHKVANIIGQTMQYHPHGDASIGDALVKLGQKELLVDTQGNWGDVRTGDSAAAPRYIEARLTKFALEVLFNPRTTEWKLSYDGRNQEPETLPSKFPLLLAMGTEGIAVGLSTKILPHNFVELIKASIKILEDKSFTIYPDFQTGGLIDVTNYKSGKRGGKVRVRANVSKIDKSTLSVTSLPFGITTTSLIDSILKASDKGKIKIKKIIDNTAADVEILVTIPSGISPDKTLDALYAFTNCEVSISPNACVILEDKPQFLNVKEILRISTMNTKELLRRELEIKKDDLEEKWHFASLEKIFIEKRIYRDIEECESFEEVIEAIDLGLKKYIITPSEKILPNETRLLLTRDITRDDIIKLTEIKIKRISKYNSFKADELLKNIEEELEQVKYDLAHLTEYAVAFFQMLLDKYGKGRERRTMITEFDEISASKVIINNTKLYVNYKEGFVGSGLKKDTFLKDCSDMDDIIGFRKDGKFMVVRMSDKVAIGPNLLHVDVWKNGDKRTTYNMIYVDAKTGRTMAKRFFVHAITRNKEIELTTGFKGSKVLYFSANANAEAEVVNVQLTPGCKARKKIFDFDFADIDIKGRSSKGNILTKYPVRKITLKEKGKSSLGAIKLWIDEVSGKINESARGKLIGKFDTGDKLICLYKDGSYEVLEPNKDRRFEMKDILEVAKFDPENTIISVVYYEGEKEWTMVKRFKIETTSDEQKFNFITEHKRTKLLYASLGDNPRITYKMRIKGTTMPGELNITDFIDVKGWKALGNKLSDHKLIAISEIEPPQKEKKETLSPGDTIDFDLDNSQQGELF